MILTDEEIVEITKGYALSLAFPYSSKTTPELFARAIEEAIFNKLREQSEPATHWMPLPKPPEAK